MFVCIVECQAKLTGRSVTSQLWRVTARVHTRGRFRCTLSLVVPSATRLYSELPPFIPLKCGPLPASPHLFSALVVTVPSGSVSRFISPHVRSHCALQIHLCWTDDKNSSVFALFLVLHSVAGSDLELEAVSQLSILSAGVLGYATLPG